MKSKCNLSSFKRREFSIVRKGGIVVLPPGFTTLRLGQRVFFRAGVDGIIVSTKPRAVVGGRLLSRRVRRAIRSLARYGPRAISLTRKGAPATKRSPEENKDD